MLEMVFARLISLNSYNINCMLHYFFTVINTAILYSITAFIKLNFAILSSFILIDTLKVEGKASDWTVIVYGLACRSTNSILTKDGFIVWSVFIARQVTSGAHISFRTGLVFRPNSIFKCDSSTFATVSCPIQNVLNNCIAPSQV